MDVQKIRELRLAYPFRPFNLVTDDGHKLLVDKPYYLAIAESGRVLLHSSLNGGFELLKPARVHSVEFLPRNDEQQRIA